MNVFRKVWLLCLVIMALGSLGSEATAQASRSVSLNVFYRELQPYGHWVKHREYGRAWIPRVEKGFQPYVTHGYWDYTEYGNTWVSEYRWGWAPFHYGRWTYDDFYGWIWIPDTEWAPAWVSWRYDNDYYGWAPLGPGVDINIIINVPRERWVFVPKRYVTSRRFYDYCIPGSRADRIYSRSRIMDRRYDRDNRRYYVGPGRADLERETRSPIQVKRYDEVQRNSRPEYSRGNSRDDSYGRNRGTRNGDYGNNTDWRNRGATYDRNRRNEGGDLGNNRQDNARDEDRGYGADRRNTGSPSNGGQRAAAPNRPSRGGSMESGLGENQRKTQSDDRVSPREQSERSRQPSRAGHSGNSGDSQRRDSGKTGSEDKSGRASSSSSRPSRR